MRFEENTAIRLWMDENYYILIIPDENMYCECWMMHKGSDLALRLFGSAMPKLENQETALQLLIPAFLEKLDEFNDLF